MPIDLDDTDGVLPQGITEIKSEDKDGILHRDVLVVPAPQLSEAIWALVGKLLGNKDLSYVDHQTKDNKTKTMSFEVEPPVMKDKIKVSGQQIFSAVDDNSCKHHVIGMVDFDYPVLADTVKQTMVAETKKAQMKLPEAVAKWKEAQRLKDLVAEAQRMMED